MKQDIKYERLPIQISSFLRIPIIFNQNLDTENIFWLFLVKNKFKSSQKLFNWGNPQSVSWN